MSSPSRATRRRPSPFSTASTGRDSTGPFTENPEPAHGCPEPRSIPVLTPIQRRIHDPGVRPIARIPRSREPQKKGNEGGNDDAETAQVRTSLAPEAAAPEDRLRLNRGHGSGEPESSPTGRRLRRGTPGGPAPAMEQPTGPVATTLRSRESSPTVARRRASPKPDDACRCTAAKPLPPGSGPERPPRGRALPGGRRTELLPHSEPRAPKGPTPRLQRPGNGSASPTHHQNRPFQPPFIQRPQNPRSMGKAWTLSTRGLSHTVVDVPGRRARQRPFLPGGCEGPLHGTQISAFLPGFPAAATRGRSRGQKTRQDWACATPLHQQSTRSNAAWESPDLDALPKLSKHYSASAKPVSEPAFEGLRGVGDPQRVVDAASPGFGWVGATSAAAGPGPSQEPALQFNPDRSARKGPPRETGTTSEISMERPLFSKGYLRSEPWTSAIPGPNRRHLVKHGSRVGRRQERPVSRISGGRSHVKVWRYRDTLRDRFVHLQPAGCLDRHRW